MLKAIKNTHRHPANKILHVIGLILYAIAIMVILSNAANVDMNSYAGLFLFMMAIALFLLGHKIEGNIRAITWVIIFRYIKKIINDRRKPTQHEK